MLSAGIWPAEVEINRLCFLLDVFSRHEQASEYDLHTEMRGAKIVEFHESIEALLRSSSKPDRQPSLISLSTAFAKKVHEVMPEIVGVLKQLVTVIPGTELIAPSTDPGDCGYYVAAARIAAYPEAGFQYPSRIYFIVLPADGVSDDITSNVIRIARVVAIGSATRGMSLRAFLRAWNAAGIGGVVVYEGTGGASSVQTACKEAVLRYLEHRHDAMQTYERSKQPDRIILWPIDPNFQVVLCTTCLVPAVSPGTCAFCGSRYRPPKRAQHLSMGESPEVAAAIDSALTRRALVRFTIGDTIFRGVLIGKNRNVIGIQLRSAPRIPQPNEKAELTLEEGNTLYRYAAVVRRVERERHQLKAYLALFEGDRDGIWVI